MAAFLGRLPTLMGRKTGVSMIGNHESSAEELRLIRENRASSNAADAGCTVWGICASDSLGFDSSSLGPCVCPDTKAATASNTSQREGGREFSRLL